MHRVLFVDDDGDLREMVVDLLTRMGVACNCVATFAEVQELVEAGIYFQLAILDINLGAGQPSGVDVYRWLRRRNFDGRVAFLTGHGRAHPLVADALHSGDATVHDKPMTVTAFRTMVGMESHHAPTAAYPGKQRLDSQCE